MFSPTEGGVSVADILSPEEIGALLAAMGAGDAQGLAPATEGEVLARPYDFGRPDKLSKDQLQTLRLVHETFARLLETSLSAYLRMLMEVEVERVDQERYEEVSREHSPAHIVALFALEPLEGSALLQLSPDVGFAMIDRLLGGPGTTLARPRELTEIEGTVVRRVLVRALQVLQEAWAPVVAVQARLERIEPNPQFLQLLPPRETVITVRLSVRLRPATARSAQTVTGQLSLVLPYGMLEPVERRLTSHHFYASRRPVAGEGQQEVLRQRLEMVEVPVTAVLGRCVLTVRELLELKAGDVLVLDTSTDGCLPIMVGDRVKFYGRPGLVGDHVAVQVEELVMREGKDDE